jgi:hypothetical protein
MLAGYRERTMHYLGLLAYGLIYMRRLRPYGLSCYRRMQCDKLEEGAGHPEGHLERHPVRHPTASCTSRHAASDAVLDAF